MKNFAFTVAFVAFALSLASSVATAEKGCIELEDLNHEFSSVAVSPDGKLIAANLLPYGSNKPVTIIWERSTGRKLRTLPRYNDGEGGNNGASLVAFSPDGKKLATTCYAFSNRSGGGYNYYYNLIIWDVATWRRENTLKTEEEGFQVYVSFSPNGKLLLTDTRYCMSIWSIEKEIMLKKYEELAQTTYGGDYSHCRKIKFSADGKTLLDTKNGWRIDIAAGKIIPKPEWLSNCIYHVETTSGELLSLIKSYDDGKHSYRAVFSKDEKTPGKSIPIEIVREISEYDPVSPDGNYLCTNRSSKEGYEIWDLRTGKRIGRMPFEELGGIRRTQ